MAYFLTLVWFLMENPSASVTQNKTSGEIIEFIKRNKFYAIHGLCTASVLVYKMYNQNIAKCFIVYVSEICSIACIYSHTLYSLNSTRSTYFARAHQIAIIGCNCVAWESLFRPAHKPRFLAFPYPLEIAQATRQSPNPKCHRSRFASCF